ncbi:SusC/RagA family TonB-linked outer membrane protein [Niastella koreensis]|uniref:TonB-dependent receptor n=2 Tax=Niastella koreensis TaxID=354356 RepID=G8TCY9_NIAKG|nr:TonB-dependent receptor [Niastella koreensis]AEV97198.1 TonB-dependent receptor [Niastella koreensis GR20-10]OQP39121.1 SusC/RagA family TonB-linked outer membrane protein [Niastella koreensis]
MTLFSGIESVPTKTKNLRKLLITMKLLFYLLFATMLQVNANSYAQGISLKGRNIPIERIFMEIRKQTGVAVLCESDVLENIKPLTVNFNKTPVPEVLEFCLKQTPYTYQLEKGSIVIKTIARTEHNQPGIDVQQKVIKGRVTDEEGKALPGVNVRTSNGNGTITDGEGFFSLAVPDNVTSLTFSSVGFQSRTVTLGEQTILNVLLNKMPVSLNEVVVIGYGTKRRADLVGAVDQVKAAQIEGRPVGNVMQALQGLSPSLVIQQRNMNPNNNSMNINLRGISTFGNNSPLLVIDGVISNDVSDMNNLNPNDIEEISILKDAGSAAIYGSRSANGVILISTKKGKQGMKPVVSFSGLVGSQNPQVLVKPLKGYQNALLRNDSYINSGADPIYSPEQIRQFAKGDSQYWLKGILKNGLQQNYNFSIQGGATNTSYMISLGYYNQQSNFKGPDYGLKRYNLRSNLTTQIGRLKLSTILWYNRSEGNAYQGDEGFLIADASRLPVYNTYILKDSSGKYYNNDVLTGGNPLAALEHGGYIKTTNDDFQGSLNGELKLMDGLKAKGLVGLDVRPENRLIRRFYWPVYSLSGSETPINQNSSKDYSIEDYSGNGTLLNVQAMLEYNKTFAGMHNVSALAGFSNESYRQKRQEIKMKYVDPVLGIPIDGTIIDPTSYNTVGGTTERSIYSYFGRVGYAYGDKYYAEGSFRYDGSSKFAKNNRWGFFPSVSLGWRISEEDFFDFWKNNIGDLKIRGTYGNLGNQNIDDYQTLTTYDIYINQYGFNNVGVPGTGYTFGNPELRWETTSSANLGADGTFLKGSLRVGFDFFHKLTKGILLAPQTPMVLGGAVPKANLGEMKNQGWELTINYSLRHRDFNHSFGLNIADSWNEVTKFEGYEQISQSDEIERIVRVGLPLYSYYGYKTNGLFQNDDDIKSSALPVGFSPRPGDVKYKDRNGDGIINDNDRYVLGHAFPRLTFGFNYILQWKGLELNMLWQGVGKRDMALRGETIEPFHGGYSFVMFEHQLDYWTPANPGAKWPRLTAPGTASTINNYGKGSDFNIFNGAYARLKNIQLGYTLPKGLTARIGVSKVHVFVNGQNLLTLSKIAFVDPESTEFGNNMNASGANSARNYPRLKYIGGGVHVEF